MAPKTYSQRFLISLCLLLIAGSVFQPSVVSAAPISAGSALPDLRNFASSLKNGNGNTLRGAYANGLFAFPVIQQPSSNAGFVSTTDNTLTQFSMASQFGNVGLLAHDNLTGQYFSQLVVGQSIQLVYGDGHIEYFRVSQVNSYQAVSPSSVNSDFIDLHTQEYLSANTLFVRVYAGSRHVTFQTCILKNGNPSWGRLFILAEPEAAPSPSILSN